MEERNLVMEVALMGVMDALATNRQLAGLIDPPAKELQ